MGVCLAYQTATEVPADVRAQIASEAERLNASRRWWCEPFIFDVRTNGPGLLSGDTKIFLPGYTAKGEYVEVDFADDSFMACHDAAFIMATLEEWARRFDISWDLELERPIGSISPSGLDESVREIRSLLAEQSGYDLFNPESNLARVSEIDTRYGSRIDE